MLSEIEADLERSVDMGHTADIEVAADTSDAPQASTTSMKGGQV
ncbi:hypothetical protein [Gordonia sp. 852002-10350_SCH5691597]|nr:hypothetical protein [Gordonia sp. 852002-10350_SCH5691597]